MLTFEGYEAVGCSNKEDAIKYLSETKFDLIISDLNLSEVGGEGFEILELVRSNPLTKNTPFIIATARVDRETRRQGMLLGADDFLDRPFTVFELTAAVEIRFARQETPSTVKTSKYAIFLSYSRKDTQFMGQLRAALQSHQLTVWTDEGIEPGTPAWDAAIEEAMENSGCMVVILTPNTKHATGVRNEIHYANLHSIRIFTLLAAGEPKDAVPYILSGTQWVDIRENYDEGIQRLADAVRKHMNLA